MNTDAPSETRSTQTTEAQAAVESFKLYKDNGILARFKRLFNRNGAERDDDLIDLVNAREENNDTPLSQEEKALVAAALEFSNSTADSASIPRADMVAVSVDSTFDDIIRVFAECQHSRLPVIRDNLDDIIGFITLKDMVGYIHSKKKFNVEKTLRPCTFVPDNLSVAKVLEIMRKEKVQMAIVVDEYGGTAGLVTLKDIIEILIGEMEDEHETATPEMLTQVSPDRLAIDPRLPLEDLEEHLNTQFLIVDSNGIEVERDFETVGGLIFALARRVPEVGETFATGNGYALTVTEGDGRRLQKIELTHAHSAYHKAPNGEPAE